MRLKQEEINDFHYTLKRKIKVFFRTLFNRKTKIISSILFILAIFFIGFFSGLLLFGFFGTFDKPSQRAIDLMHLFGIFGLKDVKVKVDRVLKENIKIPFNYIVGQFSNPEKIYIDIAFDNYKKIEYHREQALKKDLLTSAEKEYVPGKIRYNDKEVRVRLRLKGDLSDHWKGNKWSFRIKVKDRDTLFGMRTFSIQDPKTRDYLNEFIYHKALKREGVMAPRYEFIEVVINGKNKGTHAIEEHFEKQLIENNNQREGVIIKFNEDLVVEDSILIKDVFSSQTDIWKYLEDKTEGVQFYRSEVETFDNDKILNDSILSKQFEEAKNLLEAFRDGSLKTSEVFDVDKLAKYFAINTLFRASHASGWNNIRFYYNPITARLEPIGFDASSIRIDAYYILEEYLPTCLYHKNTCMSEETSFYEIFFRDKIFFEKYIKELEKISQESYLDNFFLEMDGEIEKNKKAIHKDDPSYHFDKGDYYNNQKQIILKLNQIKSINVYFKKSYPNQNKFVLEIGNVDSLPLEIENVVYNDSVIFDLVKGDRFMQPRLSFETTNYKEFEFLIPENFEWNNNLISELKVKYSIFGLEDMRSEKVLPWSYVGENFLEASFIRQKAVIDSNEFLDIDNETKKIFFKKGMWTINKSLIFPEGFSIYANEGTIINLINEATILSYSNLQFQGSKKDPIQIVSSDGTGQGLTVLNSPKESNLEYVHFKNLSYPSKNNWELTGAITFYEAPVTFNNILFSGVKAEDTLNVINSKFEIRNSIFEDCFSDCLDIDFSTGKIINTLLNDSGNDCLDFSGSLIYVENINLFNCKDKGVSVGERSNVTLSNIEIDGSYIGVASKDVSRVNIDKIKISNSQYGFAVYQKKSEFGPASIKSFKTNISSTQNSYVIEKKSSLVINEKLILGGNENVYTELYPGG